MSSIRLHPKFGLNPKLEVCGYCGRGTGTILLPGAAVKTDERFMVGSKLPCEKCREERDAVNGIWLLEGCEGNHSKRKYDGIEPTFRMLVVTENFVKRFLAEEEAAQVLKVKGCWLDRVVFSDLFRQYQEMQGKKKSE